MSGEFWLISAPGEKTCQQTWERLNGATVRFDLSLNFKFPIPDLKVGTLDTLVGLSDELGKLDSYVDNITHKLAHYLGEVLEDQKDRLAENLMANRMDLSTYVTRFQWDVAKYPIKLPLKSIAEIISKQVSQMDGDLKTKSHSYNSIKGNLQTLERKATGSLLSRNLGDIVKKEDFINESEYLTTLLVVVQKNLYSDWGFKYEKLSDMVVPRSTRMIYEDNDHGLYSVTLFKKVVDEYKLHARENKFMVREFTYNEEELNAGKSELNKLAADKKRQYGPLVRWLKINFSEAFQAWVHVKALRVFVESVLRYGLPVNFQPMILQPYKKTQKKLKEVLNTLYGHLDGSNINTKDAKGVPAFDMPGLMSNTEYFPYVFYPIQINFCD
ncbi:V-type proton ATPase subunit C [Strongylocentrotus purpuratus]|uniref:V-type proton ATPase subunit C n=1 Tax=Strongylocentrotus purpuratus TaxID=7668 RepID=A0A7M7PE86_STRPU|nr:V-type proton ATPase subunit C-like [Strongylocentrotus purpuratus]XP_030850919.1 V-type proton ATPase subunit C [Strongylocentrotus purpuratus]|eukprot:XP_001201267.2 PREDICTED: V-type proton ATPase subunit C [Strongylocentrotus purpuratus]